MTVNITCRSQHHNCISKQGALYLKNVESDLRSYAMVRDASPFSRRSTQMPSDSKVGCRLQTVIDVEKVCQLDHYLLAVNPAAVRDSACFRVRGKPCSIQPWVTQSNWLRRSVTSFSTSSSSGTVHTSTHVQNTAWLCISIDSVQTNAQNNFWPPLLQTCLHAGRQHHRMCISVRLSDTTCSFHRPRLSSVDGVSTSQLQLSGTHFRHICARPQSVVDSSVIDWKPNSSHRTTPDASENIGLKRLNTFNISTFYFNITSKPPDHLPSLSTKSLLHILSLAC